MKSNTQQLQLQQVLQKKLDKLGMYKGLTCILIKGLEADIAENDQTNNNTIDHLINDAAKEQNQIVWK